MARIQGRLAFGLMTLVFRVRDRLRPPEDMLRRVGVGPGQTVLDFGCGPGAYAIAAARLVGPGGRVYALDLNPLAARAVRKAAERERLGNVTPVVADSAAAVPAGSVDLAIVHDVLHLVDDPAGVVRSLHGALRHDGLLAVDDHHMTEAAIAATVAAGGLVRPCGGSRGTYCFRPSGRPGGSAAPG